MWFHSTSNAEPQPSVVPCHSADHTLELSVGVCTIDQVILPMSPSLWCYEDQVKVAEILSYVQYLLTYV